jgi:HK97 gp10 family phage protein
MAQYYKEDHAGRAAFEKRIDLELMARMETACSYAEGRVKDTLSQMGSGITYRIKGKYHQASAPGEPPTVLTGNLRGSLDHWVAKLGREIVGIVSVGAEYAPALEFGTRKMAPRPFMRTTINQALPVIWRIIKGV